MLVTGVARQLGGRLVRRIQRDPEVDRVIGVDAVPPEHPLGGADFILADIRQPGDREGARGVRRGHRRAHGRDRHAAELRRPGRGQGDQRHRHHAAARRLPEVADGQAARGEVQHRACTGPRRAIPRCSPRPRRPSRCPAAASPRTRSRSRGTCAASRGAGPTSRCACCASPTSWGPSADSPLAEYFSLPVLPTVLRLRPAAAVRARGRRRSTCCGSPRASRGAGTLNSGTFNIAGEGVLLLSQCSRRLGRPTVPVLLPAVTWVGPRCGRSG